MEGWNQETKSLEVGKAIRRPQEVNHQQKEDQK